MKTKLFASMEKDAVSFGTWISIGTPVITELACSFNFDWLLLDLEHGCLTESEVLPNLQAMRHSNAAAIVRVPTAEPSLIARMLDRGAHGIMVPHVTSAEAAREIVAATRYAPQGQRGYSRTVRAYDYGLKPPEENSPHHVIMAQIENHAGIEAAEEIASIDGIDVLFVGPADLTHDLSARGMAALYQEGLSRVSTAAQKHGKKAGILVRDIKDIPNLKATGYSILAVDSDLGLLRKGYQESLKYCTS